MDRQAALHRARRSTMSSTSRMTKYTTFVAIAICMLYFAFRASETELASIKSLSVQYSQSLSETVSGSRHRDDMELDEGQHLAHALQSTFTPSKSYPSRFPRTVWQAWLGPDEHGAERFSERTETWEKVKGFEYKLLKGTYSASTWFLESGQVHTHANTELDVDS